ncbi:MarR family winged helix-turn-helix transcriptional regulator [Bombella saccharophila]|uniref:MarR family transcriptional regulator n=1 Tax=Bombella saccharophila TaxID=2967338 RepID=A0ABT3W947_9PROT|nr:MarR family transcriptional regulator [Bombella saccharophila]MCX5614327.1 MarR family transcriptional regulator [Bombella saccharophila]
MMDAHLYLRENSIRQSFEGLLIMWRCLALACEEGLAQYGLGPAHHRILFMISCHEGLLPSELCTKLGITKQSLGRALGELKSKALVEQREDHNDKRRRPVFLTPKGKNLEQELFGAIRSVVTQAYKQVDGTAVDGFRRVLRAVESLSPPQ